MIPDNVMKELVALYGRADVQMMLDIAAHAHDEALTALQRVCETAPDDHIKVRAMLIALKALSASANETIRHANKTYGETPRAGRS